MPTTIGYPDYRRDIGLDLLHPEPSPGIEGEPQTFVGLSAFNVPTEIHAEITPSGDLRLVFNYSDREPSERDSISLPGVPGGVELLLARESKKITQIHATSPREFLERNRGCLNPAAIAKLAAQFPPRRQKVLTRNAEAISRILEAMPPRLRAAMVKAAELKRRK